MFAVHTRWRLSNVHKLWYMQTVHDRRWQSNVQDTTHTGSITSTSSCRGVHAKGSTGMPNPTTTEWCSQSKEDAASSRLTDAKRPHLMRLSTTYVSWPMPLVVDCCRFPEADMPWLMLPAISRRWSRPVYQHRQRLILPVVRQSFFPLAHYPWLMLPNIGWYEGRPTDAHTPRQLCGDQTNVALCLPTLT